MYNVRKNTVIHKKLAGSDSFAEEYLWMEYASFLDARLIESSISSGRERRKDIHTHIIDLAASENIWIVHRLPKGETDYRSMETFFLKGPNSIRDTHWETYLEGVSSILRMLSLPVSSLFTFVIRVTFSDLYCNRITLWSKRIRLYLKRARGIYTVRLQAAGKRAQPLRPAGNPTEGMRLFWEFPCIYREGNISSLCILWRPRVRFHMSLWEILCLFSSFWLVITNVALHCKMCRVSQDNKSNSIHHYVLHFNNLRCSLEAKWEKFSHSLHISQFQIRIYTARTIYLMKKRSTILNNK